MTQPLEPAIRSVSSLLRWHAAADSLVAFVPFLLQDLAVRSDRLEEIAFHTLQEGPILAYLDTMVAYSPKPKSLLKVLSSMAAAIELN